MKKRVLVTGGAGFLGANLVRRLVAEGHEVVVMDDCSRGNAMKLAGIELEFVKWNVCNTWKCHPGDVTFSRPFDTIFHLAAINGTRNFYERPWEVLNVSVSGMFRTVEFAISEERCWKKKPELVLYSSSEAYQTPPSYPAGEGVPLVVPDPREPRYSYGCGKIVSEVAAFCSGAFSRVLVIRPHNVYGPDAGYDHVIPELTMKVARSWDADYCKVVTIKGNGNRCYIYVDDFTDAVHHLWSGGHDGIFHVGTQEEVSAIGILGRISTVVSGSEDVPFCFGAPPAGETDRRVPDTRKLLSTGWSPKTSLDEGLRKTVAWYLAHRSEWPV